MIIELQDYLFAIVFHVNVENFVIKIFCDFLNNFRNNFSKLFRIIVNFDCKQNKDIFVYLNNN